MKICTHNNNNNAASVGPHMREWRTYCWLCKQHCLTTQWKVSTTLNLPRAARESRLQTQAVRSVWSSKDSRDLGRKETNVTPRAAQFLEANKPSGLSDVTDVDLILAHLCTGVSGEVKVRLPVWVGHWSKNKKRGQQTERRR